MAINRYIAFDFLYFLCVCSIHGTPWMVTSYMQESFITAPETTMRTSTSSIVPAPPSPSPSALITVMTAKVNARNARLPKEEVLLPRYAQVTVPATISAPLSQSGLPTYYFVPVTYTPPKKCNANWEFITLANILVDSQPTPWSTFTTSTTEIAAVLYPTDVADIVYLSASLFNMPEFIRSCQYPVTSSPTTTYPPGPNRTVPIKPTTGVSKYGIKCGAENPQCVFCFKVQQNCLSKCAGNSHKTTGEYLYCEDGDYWIWGGTAGKWPFPMRETVVVAIFIAFFLLFFLLGLRENILNFRDLMQGKQAHLGIPWLWAILTFGLSFVLLGPIWCGRSEEDQLALYTQWKEMPRGEKARLYFRYAWRWTYPSMLGPEPPAWVIGPICKWIRAKNDENTVHLLARLGGPSSDM